MADAEVFSNREMKKLLTQKGRGSFASTIQKAISTEFESQGESLKDYQKESITALRKTEEGLNKSLQETLGKEITKSDDKKGKEEEKKESKENRERRGRENKLKKRIEKREQGVEKHNERIEKIGGKAEKIGGVAGEQVATSIFSAMTGPVGAMFESFTGIDVGRAISEKFSGLIGKATGLFKRKKPEEMGGRGEGSITEGLTGGLFGGEGEPASEDTQGGMAKDIHKMRVVQDNMYGIDKKTEKRNKLQFRKDKKLGKEGGKEGGIFQNILSRLGLGGGGAGAGVMGMLGKGAKMLGKIAPGLIGIGLTLTDLLGKGGALEMFKKGETGKGIATLAFGRTLKDKTAGGKALGIGKQAVKWGGMGAQIGMMFGPAGAAIGGAIGAGVGAIGTAIKLAIETGWFKKAGKWVKGAVGKAGKWIGGVATSVGDWVKGTAQKVGEFIKGTAQKIDKGIEKIPVVGKMYKLVKGFYGGIAKGIGDFIGDVKEIGFAMAIKKNVKKVIDKVKGFVGGIGKGISDFVGMIKEKGLANIVREKVSDAGQAIGGFVSDMGDKMGEVWGNFRETGVGKVLDKIAGKAIDRGIAFVKGMGEGITNFFADVKEKGLGQAIKDTVGGILLKVWLWVRNVGKTIGDFFGDVWKGFKKFLGIDATKTAEDFKKELGEETSYVAKTMEKMGVTPADVDILEAVSKGYKKEALERGITEDEFNRMVLQMLENERKMKEESQKREDETRVRREEESRDKVSQATINQQINTGNAALVTASGQLNF